MPTRGTPAGQNAQIYSPGDAVSVSTMQLFLGQFAAYDVRVRLNVFDMSTASVQTSNWSAPASVPGSGQFAAQPDGITRPDFIWPKANVHTTRRSMVQSSPQIAGTGVIREFLPRPKALPR